MRGLARLYRLRWLLLGFAIILVVASNFLWVSQPGKITTTINSVLSRSPRSCLSQWQEILSTTTLPPASQAATCSFLSTRGTPAEYSNRDLIDVFTRLAMFQITP